MLKAVATLKAVQSRKVGRTLKTERVPPADPVEPQPVDRQTGDRQTSDAQPGDPQQRRLALLTSQVGRLRVGRRGGPAVNDTWLLSVGGGTLALGLLLIGLGWYGSAHSVLPFEQIPYLLSGGILGLALAITGGLLYFSYWLTRLVRDTAAERIETVAHQQRLEATLSLIAARLTPAAPPGAASPAAALVVTATGGLIHRPDCVATVGMALRPADASRPGALPCGLCQPDLALLPVRRPRARRSPASAQPQTQELS